MEIVLRDDNLESLALALSKELLSLRYITARNELLFERMLKGVALGQVLDADDFEKTISKAAQSLDFTEVKAQVEKQLSYEK